MAQQAVQGFAVGSDARAARICKGGYSYLRRLLRQRKYAKDKGDGAER